MILRATTLCLALLCAMPVTAQDRQEQKKDDKTLDKAGEILSQPARDVGIAKTKIPDVLTAAVSQPYASPGKGCKALAGAIGALNAVLGPDFDTNGKENANKFGQLAAAGGEAVVNSLIPLRGIVREVSGAAPAERRLEAAINAGLARRGYLRGLAVSRGCKLPAAPATQVARRK